MTYGHRQQLPVGTASIRDQLLSSLNVLSYGSHMQRPINEGVWPEPLLAARPMIKQGELRAHSDFRDASMHVPSFNSPGGSCLHAPPSMAS